MDYTITSEIELGAYKIASNNGLVALLDSCDKLLLPFLYDSFKCPKRIGNSGIIAVQHGKEGYYSFRFNRLLVPCIYNSINELDFYIDEGHWESVLICKRDAYIDIWDQGGTMLCSDSYDQVDFVELYKQDLYIGVTKLGKCSIFSPSLNCSILPFEFDEINVLQSNPSPCQYFKVRKYGCWGLVRISSESPYYEWVIRCNYDDILVSNNCYIVKVNGHYGVLAEDGSKISSFDYDYAKLVVDSCDRMTEDHACYVLGKGQKFYLLKNNTLITMPGEILQLFFSQYALYKKDGLLGLTTQDGKVALSPIYEDIKIKFREYYDYDDMDVAYFLCKYKGKYGAYTHKSKHSIPCIFDKIEFSSEDSYLTIASMANGFSIYGSSLECIVPRGYEKFEVLSFESDWVNYTFIKVYSDNKVGLYSPAQGRCVPCCYDEIEIVDLLRGFTRVQWLRPHDNHDPFWFIVSLDSKKGLISRYGEVLVPCVLDEMTFSETIQVSYKGQKYEGLTLDYIQQYFV